MKKFSLPRISEYCRVETFDETEAKELEKNGFERLRSRRFGRKIVLKKKKEEWVKFEDEIKSFLEALEFRDVEGGYLGRYPIEVYGGSEGTFLIIDCTMKEEPGFKSIRSKILQNAAKKRDLRRAVRSRFGGKYKEIKFIVAMKGIEVSEEDEDEARNQGITVWDERYIDMNKKLFKSAGPLVAYWILKELGARPKRIRDGARRSARRRRREKRHYEIPAFRIKGKDGYYFNFLMDAYSLAKAGYVSRMLAGEKGYQRILYPSKVNKIARFVEDGGSFPNNIIVNWKGLKFRPKKRLSKDITFGMVRVPNKYASAEIVDGQHRVYGIWKANQHYGGLAITAFTNLEPSDQAIMYDVINRTQKPVEANEIWALYPVTKPFSREAWIFTVARKFNGKGIFEKKIYIPGISKMRKIDYPIYLANFCDGIKKHSRLLHHFGIEKEGIPLNKFKRASETARKILDGFFTFISEVGNKVSSEWERFSFSNNGSVVMLRHLGYFFDYLASFYRIDPTNTKKVLKKKSLLEERLKEFYSGNASKIDELIRDTSSEGGRVELAERMGVVIENDNPGYGGEGVKKRKKTPEYMLLDELEKELRKCIIDALSKISEDWKEKLPSGVRERAEQKEKRDRKKGIPIRENLLCYVGFSEYKVIIYENWGVFKEIFDEKAFVGKLEELEPIRDALRHVGRALTGDEITRLKLYSRDIRRKIEKWRKST